MTTIEQDKKMKHFRKWAEGRNPLMAAMALRIAGFSKELFQLCEFVREGKRIEGNIPLPSLKTWLKLYKNPKRIGKALLNSMSSSNKESAEEAYILKILEEGAIQFQNNHEKAQNELKKLTQDEWSEIKENTLKMMEEFKELIINDHISEFNKKENEEFKKNFTKPEFIFFPRVLAPCFSIYKTYPLELLKRAKSGDDKALDQIIRLDKSIIFEPKISEIIHQAQGLKEQARMSMIKKAFTSKPIAPLKLKTIKCNLGGLISYFSIALKQKINAADIWHLYDAISLDTSDDIDQDFADMTEETFSKEIQNARKMWHVIILPEKK